MMFRPGFNASSIPPETCVNTSSALLTIPANRMRGWMALNLVNSGAVNTLRVSLMRTLCFYMLQTGYM